MLERVGDGLLFEQLARSDGFIFFRKKVLWTSSMLKINVRHSDFKKRERGRGGLLERDRGFGTRSSKGGGG